MVAHIQHRANRPLLGEAGENKKGIPSGFGEMPLISVLLLTKAW
jgi:hypothetical protein